MGKIIADGKGNGDHEEFLQGIQQMYSGTKKWGAVRVTIKRSKSVWLVHLYVTGNGFLVSSF